MSLAKIRENMANYGEAVSDEDLALSQRQPASKKTKLIKAASGNAAAVSVSPREINLSAPDSVGEEPVGIGVIGGVGTVLRGPVGFTNTPEDIRIGGMWTFNPALISGLPSTAATPIPTLIYSPPFGFVAELLQSAAVLAMVGG